jgi:hypothetical protein
MTTPIGQRLTAAAASIPALPDFSAKAHLPPADVDAILLKQVQPLFSPAQPPASVQWQSQPAIQSRWQSQSQPTGIGAPLTPQSSRFRSADRRSRRSRSRSVSHMNPISAELAQAEETLMQPFVATLHSASASGHATHCFGRDCASGSCSLFSGFKQFKCSLHQQ